MKIRSLCNPKSIVIFFVFQIHFAVIGKTAFIHQTRSSIDKNQLRSSSEHLSNDSLFYLTDSTEKNRDFYIDGETGKDKKIETPQLSLLPTPNVADLLKFTNFPEIDQFGSIPIQIPIYNIDFDDFNHSIDLTYRTGGIKVDQEATWVGLGWNVLVGGSVSRVVMDLPDDEIRNTSYTIPGSSGSLGYPVEVSEFGWLNNPGFVKNFPELGFDTDNYKNSLYFKWDQQGEEGNVGIALSFIDFTNLLDHKQTKRDCEPDVFYVNIGSINEKFIIDFDGIPRIINPKEDIEIQYIQNDQLNEHRITGFIIKDVYGNVYHFGGYNTERTNVTTTFSSSCTPVFNGIVANSNFPLWTYNCYGVYETTTSYNTVWYLEKIQTPKNRIINFSFTKPSQKLTLDIPVVKCQTINTLGLDNPWNNILSIKQETECLYLDYIEFQGKIIDFDISMREDVLNSYKLDRISIKESSASIVPVYQFDFIYEYMNPQGTFKDKRLILKKLIQNQELQSCFEYHPGSLPSKDSNKQDLWGYYSIKSNGLIPRIYIYPDQSPENRYRLYPINGQSNFDVINGSDRTVDETVILTGVLKRIIHPTGGNTQFDFEPNEYFDDLLNSEIKGGGLRILKITKNDVHGNILLKKTYNYDVGGKSSGVLIYNLAFSTPTNYTPYNFFLDHYYLWEHSDWSVSKKNEYFTVRFTHNLHPSSNLDGHSVGYTFVEVIEDDHGRIIKEYYPPQNSRDNSPIVSTTSMNSWDFLINDQSFCNIIIPNSTIRNVYTKKCLHPNDTTYILSYSSPFGGQTQVEVDFCSYTDNDEVYTYNKLNNYGGPAGYFTPRYYIDNYNNVLTTKWIFNIQETSYKAFIANTCDGEILSQSSELDDKFPFIIDFTSFSHGNVVDYGSNIFPFPPLSTNSNDGLLYSKIKSIKYYKEGESTPSKTSQYNYEVIGSSDESVFGIVYDNQYTVPYMIKANPRDAAQLDAGLAYFLSTTHNCYIKRKSWSKYFYKTSAAAMVDYVVETEFLANEELVRVYDYDYTNHFLVSKVLKSQSNDKNVSEVYKYPFNYDNYIYVKMTENNMLSYPIETLKIVENEVTEGSINTYRFDAGIIVPNNSFKLSSGQDIQQSDIEYDGTIPNSEYWLLDIHYGKYVNHNLSQFTLNNNIESTILWGYDQTKPITYSKNATFYESGYTSFENNETNNWNRYGENVILKEGATAHSGENVLKANSTAGPFKTFMVGQEAEKHPGYTASVWVKGGAEAFIHIEVNGNWSTHVRKNNVDDPQHWNLIEVEIPKSKYESLINWNLTFKVYIGGDANALWDDIRFHPSDASMTTYTYAPLIGMTSQSDANNLPTYYEYDDFGRLKLIRDHKKNILKTFEYNYAH